jgi:hypothetical protein
MGGVGRRGTGEAVLFEQWKGPIGEGVPISQYKEGKIPVRIQGELRFQPVEIAQPPL